MSPTLVTRIRNLSRSAVILVRAKSRKHKPNRFLQSRSRCLNLRSQWQRLGTTLRVSTPDTAGGCAGVSFFACGLCWECLSHSVLTLAHVRTTSRYHGRESSPDTSLTFICGE